MGLLAILVLLPVVAYLLYKWATQGFDTFQERGVPYKKPWPLFGNAFTFLTNKTSLHKVMIELYRETKQHKVYGFYNFRNPFFIVNDPKLIKKMGVKDFDSFTNHQRNFNLDKDPLFRNVLVIMRDQHWRNMRNRVTPIFTGAKMRVMFTLMLNCFEESLKYLRNELNGKDSFDIELKEYFCRLSNDLIATTAFGLEINSFIKKDNEFFTIGRSLSKTRKKQMLKFIFYSIAPKLYKLLDLRAFDQSQTDYFVKLVVDTMKYREEHNIVRPDMIQLLMEAKNESNQNWSEEEIVSQCFIFFFAAFENNANLLCTTCYELAMNPDVQKKLYDEILDTHTNLNGKPLDYDILQKMKYMDMVISEALRKWTLVALNDRECGADYTVKDEDDNFICELKKGDRVWFQTVGLHWDEEYYPQPEVFDPERFNDENKRNIDPFAYTPFGVGPRSCIGNRYALMQAKAMLYYLLIDFRIERSVKTTENLLDDVRGFAFEAKNGFWVKMMPRKKVQ